MDAIEGEDSADFGPRIFDLGPNGVNFRVKVEKQGDFPTYVSSKFAMPSSIDGLDDDEDAHKKVYDNVIDLTSVFTAKSYDELKVMLDEHFYVADTSSSVDEVESPAPVSTPSPQSEPQATKPLKSVFSPIKCHKQGLLRLQLVVPAKPKTSYFSALLTIRCSKSEQLITTSS